MTLEVNAIVIPLQNLANFTTQDDRKRHSRGTLIKTYFTKKHHNTFETCYTRHLRFVETRNIGHVFF